MSTGMIYFSGGWYFYRQGLYSLLCSGSPLRAAWFLVLGGSAALYGRPLVR